MSDTPKTDELAKRDFVPEGVWIRHARRLESENAALRRDVYQCPPTSENGYEGLKWADAFEVIERDNAELHNKLVALQHQTQWECSCGGTDCEGQKENATLRSLLREAVTDYELLGGTCDGVESEDYIARVKAALGEAKP